MGTFSVPTAPSWPPALFLHLVSLPSQPRLSDSLSLSWPQFPCLSAEDCGECGGGCGMMQRKGKELQYPDRGFWSKTGQT